MRHEKCKMCKRTFPEGIIQPLAQSGPEGVVYREMCPICALGEVRKDCGPKYMFRGGMALDLYEQAVEHVKKTNQKP